MDETHPGTISPAPNRPRAVSREIAEAILFLADRMAESIRDNVPLSARMVEFLAEAAGMPMFRRQPWYRDMTESAALFRIRTAPAKAATLVVLSLVLKADMKRMKKEHVYFSWVREQIRAAPVTVPVDLEAHKWLALKYLRPSARK